MKCPHCNGEIGVGRVWMGREELERIFDKFVPVGKEQIGMMLSREHRDKIIDDILAQEDGKKRKE